MNNLTKEQVLPVNEGYCSHDEGCSGCYVVGKHKTCGYWIQKSNNSKMQSIKNTPENRAFLIRQGYDERCGTTRYEAEYLTITYADGGNVFYRDTIKYADMSFITKEQIERVFAMHFGCDVFDTRGGRDYQKGELGIDKKSILEGRIFWKVAFENCALEDRDGPMYLLLLTPLPAISDEDAIEVAKIHFSIHNIEGPLHKEYLTLTKQLLYRSELNWDVFQFLIQKGYAVPLFFAPGHPDNGKTAIELGLAIDVTTFQTSNA